MAHGGVLAGGAQGEDAVGPGGDLPLQKVGEHVEVDASVLAEGGNHGDDGAGGVVEFHLNALQFCIESGMGNRIKSR